MPLRTAVRLTTFFALSIVLLGCDKASPTGMDDMSVGRFALVAAENMVLPATVFDGIVVADPDAWFHLRIDATSGSIAIDAAGRYEQRVSHDSFIDGALGGHAIHVDRGECTRSGGQLHCTSSYLQNVEFTATLARGVLTIRQDLAGEGHVATYRYQWTAATASS